MPSLIAINEAVLMKHTSRLPFLPFPQVLILDRKVFKECHFKPDGTLFRCKECIWRSEYYFDLKRIEDEGRRVLAANTALAQQLLEARLKREAGDGLDTQPPRTPLLRELGRFWIREMPGVALVSFEMVRLLGAFFGDCVVDVQSYEWVTSIKMKEKGRVLAARGDELLDKNMDYTVEITEFTRPRGFDLFPGATAVGPFSGPLGMSVVHLLYFLGSTAISWVGDDYPGAVYGRIPRKDDKVSYWVYHEEGPGPGPGLNGPFRIARLPCSRGPLNDPHRLLCRLGVRPETTDVDELYKIVGNQVREQEMATFSYPDFHTDEQFLFEPNWTHFEQVPLEKLVHFPSPLQPSVWEDFEAAYPAESPEEQSGRLVRNTSSLVQGFSGIPTTLPTPLDGVEGTGDGDDLSGNSDMNTDLDEMETDVEGL